MRDLPAYFSQTGILIGLDETLHEACAAQHQESGLTLEDRLARLVCELGEGAVGGLVVKPGAIGGFERGLDLHRWAIKHGIHVSASITCHIAALPADMFLLHLVGSAATCSELLGIPQFDWHLIQALPAAAFQLTLAAT